MIYIFLNTVKLYNTYIIHKLNNYVVVFNCLCDKFSGTMLILRVTFTYNNKAYFTG